MSFINPVVAFRLKVGALLVALAILSFPALAQEPEPVRVDADAPVLSLDDCIRIALGGSPTLMISAERQHIAHQDVKGAYGAFLPDLSLSRDWYKSERTDFDVQQYEYVDVPFQTTDSNGDTTDWLTQQANPLGTADETVNSKTGSWGGRANLNVFAGFSKFSTLSSAKNNRAAAEASLGYTRELVIEEVITAYFNLLRYAQLLQVAEETRDQTAKELERTETYFRLGSAAKSDVLQQRVQLENTKLDVVIAGNTLKKAFADLAFAMNRPLVSAFRVDRSVLETDYGLEDLPAMYEEALAKRLDLQSTELSLEARRKDVTTAASNLYPRIDLFANYNRSDNESPYKFGAQLSESTAFGYSVSWAIFDRMQSWTSRSKAKANARIAEYEMQQAEMNVQLEIRQLHNSMVEARERAHVSRETIAQSQEELRLAQERFRVGAGTTLDIIVAQVNLANSRAQEVQAQCDFLIAQAMMNRAVGRLNPVGLSH